MDLKEFQNLKDLILKLDQKNNQLIGAKKELLKTLKDDYNLETIEELEKELKKRKKEFTESEEEIEEMIEELVKDLTKEGIIKDEDFE